MASRHPLCMLRAMARHTPPPRSSPIGPGAKQTPPFSTSTMTWKFPMLIRLDFHGESVVLHEYADGVDSSRLVSTIDIAHALASELDLDTGLLPPETLWYVKTAAGPRVALWCPPRVWSVRLQETYGQSPRRFRLPMPGLVFLCLPAAQAPYVFAAKARPKTGDGELYHCPTWN